MNQIPAEDDVSRAGIRYWTNVEKIDELIFDFRQKNGVGLSYEAIAEMTDQLGPAFKGISERALRNARKGGPVDHLTISTLAKLFGVEPSELIMPRTETGVVAITGNPPTLKNQSWTVSLSPEMIATFLRFLDAGFAPYLESGNTLPTDRLPNMLSDILSGAFATWTDTPEGQARLESQVDPDRAKRQIDNVRRIALGATKYLREKAPHAQSISQTTIDLLRSHCENISDPNTQDLWSRLVAAINRDPSSFSQKSLRIMQDLTPDIAELFSRFASAMIQIEDANSKSWISIRLPYTKTKDPYFDLIRIDYEAFLALQEYGLVSPKSPRFEVKRGTVFRYHDQKHQANSDFHFQGNFLTAVGADLFKVIKTEENLAYFDAFTEAFQERFTKKYGSP